MHFFFGFYYFYIYVPASVREMERQRKLRGERERKRRRQSREKRSDLSVTVSNILVQLCPFLSLISSPTLFILSVYLFYFLRGFLFPFDIIVIYSALFYFFYKVARASLYREKGWKNEVRVGGGEKEREKERVEVQKMKTESNTLEKIQGEEGEDGEIGAK